jgi:putative membrane protein
MLTLGLFLLVINALMLILVSAPTRGFSVSDFWTTFFVSISISVLSFFLGIFLFGGAVSWDSQMPMKMHTQWI